MTEKPQSNPSLFRTDPDTRSDLVVLNWHGAPIEEFGYYAEAYHCAAMALVKQYGTTGALRDIEASPILFLYRHAFELYLKAFALQGAKILELAGKPLVVEEIFTNHDLAKLVDCFESIIETVGWSWDMGIEGFQKKSDFVSLVKEFQSIDPKSFAFRYPTNKKGEGLLPSHFSFNLLDFSEKIDPLLKTLDGALSGLNDFWDNAAGFAYGG